ncbi:MAG: hypothetical protein MUC51_01990 [Anaerolineae bacterium]|nr:hypothetical protein [Anaerolineae bacterium]
MIQENPAGTLAPVYAATYDHIGIILWGLEKFEQYLAIEFDRLERYPDFSLGWDHEAFTYDYLAEHAPHVLEKLRAGRVRFGGRLGVGSCTYGQPLSMFIDGESNIRQLTLALDAIEQRLGQSVSIYLMSEHAFHAQLPQLLVGCGFTGAVLRTHFMMYGHNPELDAAVCWWRGADGSRIIALPTYRNQGATQPLFWHKIHGATSTLDNRILTDAISERCQLTLSDFRRAYGDKIRPLVATRADDVRSEESLILAHQDDPGVKWVTLEEAFNLLPQPRVDLATAANDFRVRMPWGYCGNWMWNRCREAEARIETAERLAAVGHALGGPTQEAALTAAWKALCVAQHHDIQICGLEEDARRFLSSAFNAADGVIATAMAAIAPRIGAGERQVIFNPLPWERAEWVDDGAGGRVVSVPGLGFRALASTSPPLPLPEGEGLGVRVAPPTFAWQAEAQEPMLRAPRGGGQPGWTHERVGRLLTPFYEVYTAETGGFRLIRDRQTGRNLLTPPSTSGTLAALVNDRDCVSSGRFNEVEISSDRATLVEQGQISGIPYRSTWRFYRHTRRIDWHGEFIFDGEWIGRPKEPLPADGILPERGDTPQTVTAWNDHEHKLRLRFYPYHATPIMTGMRDLPFLIAETTDAYIQGLYWTAISDGDVGVALFNRGLMGSVYERDGALSSVLAFSLPYVWGTRRLRGTCTYDLGILPFEGDWRDADLHRQAVAFNFPFVVRRETRAHDTLGDVWTPYVEEIAGQTMLSALYTRDGRLYARYAEHGGQPAQVAMTWLGRPVELQEVTLRERPLARVGRRANLSPWQVQTWRMLHAEGEA